MTSRLCNPASASALVVSAAVCCTRACSNALAYPHGVDRYVELVRPLLLARDVRAEVTAVRWQTREERHADASSERELAGVFAPGSSSA